MKTLKYFLIALLIPAFFLTSCKDDDDNNDAPETKTAHVILAEHLVANGMDLPALLADWIKTAPSADDHDTFVGTYNIIDIRSADSYNAGHIKGAVNSTLTGVLDAAADMDVAKPFLIVCYTGQTAGHASMALLLNGYESYVLKWGMAGWHSDPTYSDSWKDNAKQYEDLTNWSATKDLADPITYSEPTISINSENAVEILDAQVDAMLEGGLAGVKQSDVLANPTNYYINNFWDESDVDDYGNIKTAYRIKPLSIAGGEIYNLDPEADVVTYCWTGQTSSMITAYLKVLGYKSLSLKFGSNGMIYDNLHSHQYKVPTTDLPLITPAK